MKTLLSMQKLLHLPLSIYQADEAVHANMSAWPWRCLLPSEWQQGITAAAKAIAVEGETEGFPGNAFETRAQGQ